MAKKYGKYNNGVMQPYDWRTIFVVDGVSINTGDPEVLLANGYKELIYTNPEPKEGYRANTYAWFDNGTQLVQSWNYEKIEESDESSLEERIVLLENTIASLTAELKTLRGDEAQ